MRMTLSLFLLIFPLLTCCDGAKGKKKSPSTDLIIIEEQVESREPSRPHSAKGDSATSLPLRQAHELTLNSAALLPESEAEAEADVDTLPFSFSSVAQSDFFLPPAQSALNGLIVPQFASSKHGQEGFKPLPRKIGSRLKDSFFTSSIVPDLKIAPPSKLLKVQFPNHATVCLGNHLSFIDTMLEPSLNWPGGGGKSPVVIIAGKKKVLHPLYTIIMLDPDVPLFSGQLVHMLKVNVPGAGSRGHTVIPYTPPLPVLPAKNKPPSPFVHRFILLVFSQQKLVQPEHAKDYLLGESLGFRVSKFIRAFALDPVPVAGNFFYGSIYARSKVVC